MSDEIVNREDFDRKVKEIFENKNGTRVHWNKEQFDKVVKILIEFKHIKKTNEHYHYSKIYELVTIGDKNHVCLKKKRIIIRLSM